MKSRLIQGDCIEAMKEMPEASVDSLVLDPPAAISFMGRSWDSDRGGRRQWVAWFSEVMSEALRVAKPGAHAFVWALPRTSHWTAWALEDAGWEIREVVHHLFGSGFPKSKNLGNGFGTALKPAAENWILCRAPLSEKSVTANFEKHGTGVLNIDSARIQSPVGSDGRKDGGNSLGVSKVAYGEWTGEYNGASEKHPESARHHAQGRWPANLVLSHSPECQRVGVKRVAGSPKSYVRNADGVNNGIYGEGMGERAGKFSKNYADPDGFETTEAWECARDEAGNYICPVALLDEQSGTTPRGGKPRLKERNGNTPVDYGISARPEYQPYPDTMAGTSGASRFFKTFEGEPGFFYCAKSSRSERNSFTKSLPRTKNQRKRYQQDRSGRWLKRVINTHPTVKPLKLLSYLVKLVTPPGGTCLDPFAGSGTTGVACIKEGFDFIGIEQDAAYLEIAERRIAHARAEVESRPLTLGV